MKKKILLAILTMAMVLTCTACQNSETGKANDSETEVNTQVDSETQVDSQAEVDPETEVESETESEVQREISPEEEWFATVFFNNDENRIAIKFLTSEYDKPEDINLRELFHCGTYGSSSVSDEERQMLEEMHDGASDLDISKSPVDEINAALKKYMNITLDETNKVGLNELYFLENYNSYYYISGDTNMSKCEFTAFTKNDDGTVVIRYKDALSSSKTEYEVTLKAENDTYYFVSNKVVK